jgi:hypothetical protein
LNFCTGTVFFSFLDYPNISSREQYEVSPELTAKEASAEQGRMIFCSRYDALVGVAAPIDVEPPNRHLRSEQCVKVSYVHGVLGEDMQ